IRIPAGAIMAAGVAEGLEVNQAVEFAATLLGGGVAATSHFTKAGSRVLINTSPEPVTNWTASLMEDVAVIGGLWTALNYPLVFIALLIVFVVFALWVLPKIWRAIKALVRRIRAWLRGDDAGASAAQRMPGPAEEQASLPRHEGPPD
ncbi:MAG: DUF4126 domain-containing protein, partial [Pseudomonadota bacterium]